MNQLVPLKPDNLDKFITYDVKNISHTKLIKSVIGTANSNYSLKDSEVILDHFDVSILTLTLFDRISCIQCNCKCKGREGQQHATAMTS